VGAAYTRDESDVLATADPAAAVPTSHSRRVSFFFFGDEFIDKSLRVTTMNRS
jgi:hypothetical protein